MSNLYWSVYQNLENEVIDLARVIHIDDQQLNVYSMKIAELIMRISIEVESISKELYFKYGGTKPDNKDLYFDTDCMALLNSKWNLHNKKVQVVSNYFHFKKEENILLFPLKKAHKRGTSSEKWLQAYQAIKHNRGKNLEKANISNLIKSMAGLYILNLYYSDITFNLNKDYNGITFDRACGSLIFSVFIHSSKNGFNVDFSVDKQGDFDECMYFITLTENAQSIATELITNLEKSVDIEMIEARRLEPEIEKSDIYKEKIHERRIELREFFLEKIEFQAIINKQQF